MLFIKQLIGLTVLLMCLIQINGLLSHQTVNTNTNEKIQPLGCSDPYNCPFNDLSADEIKKVVSIVKTSGQFPPDIQFPIVKTQEPKKSEWLSGRAMNDRLAYVGLFNLGTNILTEVIINLKTESIIDKIDLPDGISPAIMTSEFEEAETIIRGNTEWQAAVMKRNVSLDNVKLDIWAPGPLSANESQPGQRILRAIINYQHPKSRFLYWAVLEGLIVTVDLAKGQVISIWDNDNTKISPEVVELPDFPYKPALKPLLISQPEGSSVKVIGQQIQWYKWKFQYSVDPIHGLQLYHLRYNADCEDRMVLYKISMSEMFVPYGAPGKTWRWRSAFDAGEYGMGKNANSLKIGLDAPENAILLNCIMADDAGNEPIEIDGCVAVFERDIGMLYKHTDTSTGDTDGRRGRQLVLTLMTTIANYDYTFDYVLNMDGSIEVKSRLTGIILARGTNSSSNPCLQGCLNLLDNYLTGPPHQHLFNYRIDLDVDGVKNYVAEINLTDDPIDEIDNPDGGVFSAKKQILWFEQFRDHDFYTHRNWHVININSKNNFSSPRGYALKNEEVAFTYLPKTNEFLQHAQFVTHPVWLTSYKDNEQTPGDKFPRTGKPNEGLPKYIQNQESLADTDIVLWYTFGLTHSTRPEEWPIMNIHKAGFTLIPFNFISQNSEMPLEEKCS